MEFKIMQNGKERTIHLTEPTGADQKEYLIRASKLMPKILEEHPEKTVEFLDWRDSLIVKLSNGAFKNTNKLNELKLSEKNKLVNWLEKQFTITGDVQKK